MRISDWSSDVCSSDLFAVLVVGASLGWRLGASSQLLYVALGLTGLPFYADGTGGWAVATGSTAGYLVGFILTAAPVGAMAERHQDRSLLTSVPAMLTGSAILYLSGATWLSIPLGSSASEAVEFGPAPLLYGASMTLVAPC